MIPKILHQTWKSSDVPAEWACFASSWKALHPGWEYRLWRDADNRALVAGEYPQLLQTYDAYPYAIERADVARYCMLHRFGGLYVDLDIECLQPIDALIEGQTCVAVLEPASQAAWLEIGSVVSNALMASSPGHPFLAAILNEIERQPSLGITHRDVLDVTGPLMVSRVFSAYGGNDVTLLDSRVAFPFASSTDELEVIRARAPGHESLRERLIAGGTYAVHYWANSWVGTLAGDLINPRPDDVPGYEFWPGLDSPGHDIANVGRDVRSAAMECLKIRRAVAFNTDGFAKNRLLPMEQWQPLGDGTANEGLYIKKQSRLRSLVDRALRRRKTAE